MTEHTVITCPLTGKLTISGFCPVTHKPWFVVGIKPADYAAWKAGALIQNIMPYLTTDECELLISGVSKEGGEQLFSEDED